MTTPNRPYLVIVRIEESPGIVKTYGIAFPTQDHAAEYVEDCKADGNDAVGLLFTEATDQYDYYE